MKQEVKKYSSVIHVYARFQRARSASTSREARVCRPRRSSGGKRVAGPAGALIAIPLFPHPRRRVHARNGDKIKEPLLAYLLLIGVGGADPPTTRALYFFGVVRPLAGALGAAA